MGFTKPMEKSLRLKEGKMEKQKKPIIVTTAHRGVFFGYGIPSDAQTIHLENVQMCIYWPAENKGVLGLASKGPLEGSRIGPVAPAIILREVTSMIEVTPEAEKQWRKMPWS